MDLWFGDYRLKRNGRQLFGPAGPIELSTRAFDILQYLLVHAGELVQKTTLLEAIWPGVTVEENTLHVHMSALRKLLGPSLIATIHGRGYKYTGPVPVEVRAAESGDLAKKPTIAVLPFENLSGDPGQQYFSDAITGDVTDRLTRFRALAVIGQHSASAFRGISVDFDAIQKKLKADFVVTGSVRRSQTRLRIAARLSNAADATAIWAEHYDRPISDLFDLQDEIANLVVATIAAHLEMEIATQSARKPPASLSSYECLMQGVWHFRKLTRPGNDLALSCFRQAVEHDPRSAEALAWLAMGHINKWPTDFSDDDVRMGVDLSLRAIELDPSNARCHMTCGFGQLWTQSLEVARKSIERSVALNPGESDTFANRALVSVYEGDMAEARMWLDRALQLDPIPPPWIAEFRSIIDFSDGRYAEALPGLEAIPDGAWDMMYALSCNGHLGLADRARTCLARCKAEGRLLDFLAGAAREPYRNSEVKERLADGIRKALSF